MTVATLRRKRRAGLCVSKGCRNRASRRGPKCNTCYAAEWDARHPLNRLWRNLRASAKRRGKEFDLPFEVFEQLAIAGGYADQHGRFSHSLHVDRIDGRRGYVVGNIQFLTNAENNRKQFVDGSRERREEPVGDPF